MTTSLQDYRELISELCHVVMQSPLVVKRWKALKVILKIIGRAFGIRFKRFQHERIWRFISDIPQFFEVACRGGAKTQDFIIAAFIICTGEYTQALWLAGNNKQLEEVTKKAAVLVLLFDGVSWGTSSRSRDPVLKFSNGSEIEFNPMTATSGGRRNLIVLDEGGKITERDKKDNYRFALGMAEGTFNDMSEDAITERLTSIVLATPANKRIRHCSTLAYDTPAQEFYEILEPLGLAFIVTVADVPWVRDTYQNDPVVQAMPEWWRLMEYECKLVPRGGAVFKRPPMVECVDINRLMMNIDCTIRIGGDHNSSWGHTLDAVISNGIGQYWVIEELRYHEPAPAIAFIKRYQSRYPGRVYICLESPLTINRVEDIQKAGILIDRFEPWDAPTQAMKVSLYQGLVERGDIIYDISCTGTIDQHKKYRCDELGKIPRQEDHFLDAVSHVIETPVAFGIDAVSPQASLFG